MEEEYQLAKWLAGEMTEVELKAFQKTPAYATYSKIADYSNQLKTPAFDADAMYQNVITSSESKPKVIALHQSKWLRLAAAVLIFLSLTFVLKSEISFTETAKNGERIAFTLPDYSEIVLNAGSEIQYKKWNWDHQRALNLKGEAYFKVAKGKTFDVQTDLGLVTVVGTQFNVKSRDNQMEVYCYEGKVQVKNGNQSVYITKGQRVLFENNQQTSTTFSETSPSWLRNEMVFESEHLSAIVAEIERQYAVKVVLKNGNLPQQFTGTIPSNDLNIALKVICTTFDLKATKTKATIILERK